MKKWSGSDWLQLAEGGLLILLGIDRLATVIG